MPKVSKTKKFVLEFGENVFSTDGTIQFCKICEIQVNYEKRFTITQHVKTNKHERLLNRQQNRMKVTVHRLVQYYLKLKLLEFNFNRSAY